MAQSTTARTLVLLRHAKTEAQGSGPDFDRRLIARGERDAEAAGAWLAGRQLHPDLVLCSPAVRARQTWSGVATALSRSAAPEVRYPDELYDGGRMEVFDLLQAVPDTARTVLIVGHNPTMSDVSTLLVPDAEFGGREIELKTAGLAVHRSDGPWSATERGSMPLVEIYTARG